ncbi:MAG: Ig-like domain-containing protein, partial [Treponema sp.]|nr:Ig-like domain-containing protein [Treponema sp.]
VSATYDGETVTATRSVNVCAVKEIEGESIGFCGSNMGFSVEVYAPGGLTLSPSYSWSSTGILTISGAKTNNSCTGRPSTTNSGSATIRVQVTCGTKTLTKTKSLEIYGIDVGTANGRTLMTKTGNGNSLTLTPSLKSGNTPYSGGETVAYTYSYSGSTVTVNPNGKVTANNTGDAEITVKATIGSGANAKTTTTTKTVSVIDLGGPSKFFTGQSSGLTPSPRHAPSGVSYSWKSSDSTVASVSASGVVTGRGKGDATITLTAKRSEQDKIEITKTINVTKVIYDSNIYPIADGKVELPFLGLAAYRVSLDPEDDFSLVSVTTTDTSKVAASLPPQQQPTSPKFYVEPKSAGASADVKVKLKVGEVEYEVTAFNVKGTNYLYCNSDSIKKYLESLAGTGVGRKENPAQIPFDPNNISVTEIPSALKAASGVYVDLSNITIKPSDIPSYYPSVTKLFMDCTTLVKPPKLEGFTGDSLEYFFKGCSNLEEAPVLPRGITSLMWTFADTAIKTPPVIPNSVTDLSCTFCGCSELTTAPTIPSGVTDMARTFDSCAKLTSAPSIPTSVTDVSACFEYCTSLVSGPTISAYVNSMFSCFEGCTSLKTVTIQYDHSNTNSSSRTTNSYKNTFKDCTAITMVTFDATGGDDIDKGKACLTLANAEGNQTLDEHINTYFH